MGDITSVFVKKWQLLKTSKLVLGSNAVVSSALIHKNATHPQVDHCNSKNNDKYVHFLGFGRLLSTKRPALTEMSVTVFETFGIMQKKNQQTSSPAWCIQAHVLHTIVPPCNQVNGKFIRIFRPWTKWTATMTEIVADTGTTRTMMQQASSDRACTSIQHAEVTIRKK